MKVRSEGASLLLDKLEMVAEGKQLDSEDIDEILEHVDMERWLKAYDWIDDRKGKFKNILRELTDEVSEVPESGTQNIEDLWMQKIDYGLREAVKDPKRMLSSLKDIKDYGWDSTVEKALEYLPDETELEPLMVVTVDGFNGGMFRYDTVYLSLVYYDSSLLSEDGFSHELHHMGADHWWEKDARIHSSQDKEDRQRYYFVQLFTYLTSEGIANAFCSPKAITEVGEEDSEDHDKMVRHYQEEMDSIFDNLEELVENILGYSEENVPELYSRLTMDEENRGIPPGHFLSGKMVQMMDRSSAVSRDEIIDLIKNPFEFLHLYNKAAEEMNSRRFPEELLEDVDEFLEKEIE